jgi:hypothetical protein
MEDREEIKGQWREKVTRNLGPDAPRMFEEELRSAGIRDFDIDQSDDTGLWIIIRK